MQVPPDAQGTQPWQYLLPQALQPSPAPRSRRALLHPHPHPPGVSKIVTVDVKGNSPLWLKVKDLAEGMTYRFRIRAKTFTYGPEIEANVTTGPGEGRSAGAVTLHTQHSAPQVGRGVWICARAWTHKLSKTRFLGGLQTHRISRVWGWGRLRGGWEG